MIKLKNVSVHFPKVENDSQNEKDKVLHAVNDVSLDIKSGEIYGIVGYSGAGKSTLLRVINQLQKQNSGQVFINEQEISNLSNKELSQVRKKIGMIFQHFNLLKQLTVAENIAFPLKQSKMSKAEIDAKVDELLELVGLSSHKNFYPVQLSGGQRQRVSIARALANDPEILLSDEATSALDPKTTESILDLLREINRRTGITIVLITHEMSVIKDICDRVAVMQNGEVIEEGKVFDVFTNPQTDLSKEFIQSASSTEQGLAKLLARPELMDINANDKLIRIDFAGNSAKEPLIAKLASKYDVSLSILFGNIEIIQDKPVGTLLVSLSGSNDNLEEALNYFTSENISFKEINLFN